MPKPFITLFPTLEDRKENEEIVLEPVDEVQLIEDSKAETELNDLVEISEGGAAAQDQLGALAGYVESAEKRGGMSSAMAQMVAFTHECIVSNLGYTTKGKNPSIRKSVPSLEGFRRAETRQEATHYTAESLKEQAKAIGKKALDALKALLEKITRYITDRMKSNSQLENAFKAVQGRAKGSPKNDTIKSAKGFKSAKEVHTVLNEVKGIVMAAKKITSDATKKTDTEHDKDSVMGSLFDQYEKVQADRKKVEEAISGSEDVLAPEGQHIHAVATSALTILKELKDATSHWDKNKQLFESILKSPDSEAGKGSMMQDYLRPRLRVLSQTFQLTNGAVIPALRKIAMYCKSGVENLETAK